MIHRARPRTRGGGGSPRVRDVALGEPGLIEALAGWVLAVILTSARCKNRGARSFIRQSDQLRMTPSGSGSGRSGVRAVAPRGLTQAPWQLLGALAMALVGLSVRRPPPRRTSRGLPRRWSTPNLRTPTGSPSTGSAAPRSRCAWRSMPMAMCSPRPIPARASPPGRSPRWRTSRSTGSPVPPRRCASQPEARCWSRLTDRRPAAWKGCRPGADPMCRSHAPLPRRAWPWRRRLG